jgi:hypothetical protein
VFGRMRVIVLVTRRKNSQHGGAPKIFCICILHDTYHHNTTNP